MHFRTFSITFEMLLKILHLCCDHELHPPPGFGCLSTFFDNADFLSVLLRVEPLSTFFDNADFFECIIKGRALMIG